LLSDNGFFTFGGMIRKSHKKVVNNKVLASKVLHQ
jgi:hypothetical protein